MTQDDIRDYEPIDLVEHVDVPVEGADSIAWVHVPGKDHLFLYAWDTETDTPAASLLGLDIEGAEAFIEWVMNAKVEWESTQ